MTTLFNGLRQEVGTTMPVQEFLYEAVLQHTRVSDYGFSVEDIMQGRPLPPAGARIDIAFEGTIEGPRFRGTIVGEDFGIVRADGRFDLNIQAAITTDDGARIALFADGIYRPEDGAVRENITLTTAAPQYAWVNALQVWATGLANMEKHEVRLKGYAA